MYFKKSCKNKRQKLDAKEKVILNSPYLSRLAMQRSMATDQQRRQFLKSVRLLSEVPTREIIESKEMASSIWVKKEESSTFEEQVIEEVDENVEKISHASSINLPAELNQNSSFDFLLRKRLHARAFGRTRAEFLVELNSNKRQKFDL